jgi:hypothetical protein
VERLVCRVPKKSLRSESDAGPRRAVAGEQVEEKSLLGRVEFDHVPDQPATAGPTDRQPFDSIGQTELVPFLVAPSLLPSDRLYFAPTPSGTMEREQQQPQWEEKNEHHEKEVDPPEPRIHRAVPPHDPSLLDRLCGPL